MRQKPEPHIDDAFWALFDDWCNRNGIGEHPDDFMLAWEQWIACLDALERWQKTRRSQGLPA